MLGSARKIEAEDVEAERLAIQGVLAELGEDPRTKLDYCLARVFDEQADAHGLLTRFLYAHAALSLHARHGLLPRGEVNKLVDLAHKLLQLARIKPSTSRLAFLYADLYETLAEIHGASGDRWLQLWTFHKAQLLARKAPRRQRDDQLLVTAANLFRQGNASVARELVLQTDVKTPTAESWLASLARLSGDFAAARAHAEAVSSWEVAWTEAVERRDFGPLVVKYRKERNAKSDAPYVDLWLWTRAVPQSKALEESGLGRAKSLRRHAAGGGIADEAVHAAASLIEALYDSDRPLEQRVDSAREVLDLAARTATVERELLCLAALCRWLVRFNQMDLAVCVLARYRELARGATGGRSEDPFGALADLEVARLAGRYRRNAIAVADETAFEVRQGKRLLEIGKLAARLGGLLMKGALKGFLTDYQSRARMKVETEAELAQAVVAFLSKRKGAFVKLGQICSYFTGPIGNHVAQEFAVLQAEVAAMPPSLMRRVFERELGRPPEAFFASFEELPFAAGSIGQVHRAVLKDGRRVAVKIRYENVRELIEVEVRTVAFAKPIFLRVLPTLNWDEIVQEVRQHLLAETDYRLERQNFETFAALFRDDPDVVIPRPVPELCTEGVLTTDLIEGQTFAEFAASATQEERDQAGETIARVALTSNFRHRVFNADPQPGNYLFDDGKVAFIDFGCVKRFPEPYFEARMFCNRAFFQRDLAALGRHYVGQGYVKDLEGVDLRDVWRMFEAVNRYALKDEPYQIPEDYGTRIFKAFSVDNPHRDKFMLPVHSFFSSRIEFGLTSVLHALGARVNFRRILMPLYFPEGGAPAPIDEDSAA